MKKENNKLNVLQPSKIIIEINFNLLKRLS